MPIRLWAMRTQLGTANGGIPSTGVRYDSASQTTTNTSSETTVWRENVPPRPASRYSLRCIDDLVVGHLLIEAGLHRALHHVQNRLAGRGLPSRLDNHGEPLGVNSGFQNAGRQLGGFDRDLVGGVRLLVDDVGHILQRR